MEGTWAVSPRFYGAVGFFSKLSQLCLCHVWNVRTEHAPWEITGPQKKFRVRNRKFVYQVLRTDGVLFCGLFDL